MDLYERLENRLNNRIKQNREEYEKKQTEVQNRRRAYNSQESTSAIKSVNLPTREQYTPTNSTKTSNYSLPIAEEFKRQLENNKRVQPEEEYSLPVFTKKVSEYLLPTPQKGAWIAKKTGAGIAQGTAGMAQSATTEIASNFEKGKKKSGNELLKDVANSMTLNPIQNAGDMLKTMAGSIDPTKSWWENVASFGTNLVSGTMNQLPIKKMFNTTNQVVGKILPNNASDKVIEMNNAMSKPLEELNQKLDEEGQQYGAITQTLGNTGQVVGNMAPAIATTAITKNPTAGLAVMGISAKGQSTQEALNKGATLDQAIKIGDTKAMIEVGTEMLTGGVNVFGKGALDEIIERGINKKVKNEVVNFLMKKGVDFGGEVVEEVISDLLGTVIDKGTVDPNAKYTWEDFGDTAVTTILSTMVLNALGGGYTPKAYRENIQNMQEYRQNQANNQNNTQTQQTINQNNKMAQNQNIEQIKIDSENFARQVEQVKNGTFPQNDMLVLGNTPQVLKDIGLTDLPITMTQKHLDTIMNESGKYKNANYHNLGEDIVKQLPEAINNPLDVVRSSTKDDSIVLTTYLADKNNNPVIASIKIDGKGTVNDIRIDTNVMTSAYGKSNYDNFMKKSIESGNLLYDIDRGVLKKLMGQGSNYLDASASVDTIYNVSTTNNSITSSNKNVNSPYSMQNNPNNVPTIEEIQKNNNTQQLNYNMPPSEKMRKHYKSIIESQYTTDQAKAISKELMGLDTYVPESNNKQLENADRRIEVSGADNELKSLSGRTIAGEKMTADDVAVGERLIQYYSKTGNSAQLAEAIQTTAMIGTQAGQTVQAMSLLNHQTPEGQAIWIQRSVEKMNNDLKKKQGDKAQQFNFTPEMQQKIVDSKNKQELHNNLKEVYEELGQQVHKSTIEQIDSWRYFAMLGNFRTHIRNMTGNFLMGIAQDTKNKIAGTIESTVAKFNPEMERTKTIKQPSKEVLEFAKQDYKNAQIESENKYNPKSILEKNMRTFKSDAMENTLGRLFKWNDNSLEAEDGLGLKAGYKKSLAEYITANNIDINNITDTQLAKARQYATRQAEERTFHQTNVIASAINSFTRKNKVTKAIGDAILPFVKTPANVAKTGIEYSPVGLAKSIVLDTVRLRKGDININQYIDNISKGLTGSGITVLGYALAQAGILKASGSDDDKKESFDEQSGKQAYAIQVGDKTYSIDWLAPVGIPLMVGAEIYEGLTQKESEQSSKSTEDEDTLNKFLNKAEVLTNSLTSTLDPMVEMSMISGLVSSIKSFAQGDTQALSSMVTNATKSYVNQFVPTLFGQVAKATDTVERDTTSTKSGNFPKAVDSTINQIKYKLPGLRQTLPTRKDIWGEEIKLADNWAKRFAEAGILPMTIKQINNTKVVKELNDLYDKTGEASILPTTLNKTVTIDSQKYRLTNDEYNKYKTQYGRSSYKLINDLVSSSEYKNMTNEQKQLAIEKAYSYAKEEVKMDYAKTNKKTCESSTLYDTIQYIDKNEGSKSSYLHYLAKTQGLDKQSQKINVLAQADYNNKTKNAIYINTVGKDDYNYSILEKTGINITEYLKYKVQDFESDKKDNGTVNGKTVSGSKQKKVVQYLNSMNITGKQRLLLYAINGYKTTSSQKNSLVEYVQGLKLNKSDAMKLYDKFSGFTVYKNGTIKW